MTTINTVTDRVDGEVLTAAKYNTDHGVHETNANALNAGKVELTNFGARHGPTGIHSPDLVRADLLLTTGNAVRFKAVTADVGFQSTGDTSRFHSVSLYERTTSPDTGADEGLLFALDSGGVTELYYRRESNGASPRLTRNGTSYHAAVHWFHSSSTVATGSTIYFQLQGFSGGETASSFPMPSRFRVSSLYAHCSTNAGAGQTFDYTVRKNAADTALNVLIVGATNIGQDTSNAVTFENGDLLSIDLTTSVAAGIGSHRVGLMLEAMP